METPLSHKWLSMTAGDAEAPDRSQARTHRPPPCRTPTRDAAGEPQSTGPPHGCKRVERSTTLILVSALSTGRRPSRTLPDEWCPAAHCASSRLSTLRPRPAPAATPHAHPCPGSPSARRASRCHPASTGPPQRPEAPAEARSPTPHDHASRSPGCDRRTPGTPQHPHV